MLSSEFICEQLPLYGEQVLECPVFISQSIHDPKNNHVLRYVCALFNSGGGLLHMHNADHVGQVQSKDLDTWWSGMESNLADILGGDDLCNYCDFIGNFDDPNLFLFVKTADHLCTLNYHCRLPTDTATHNVTFTSAAKLLSKTGQPSPLADLPPVPKEYTYGQIEETLKQEGKQIQFKFLSGNKDGVKGLADKISFYCSKYISAFANHYGGHIYFGIEDTTAAVFGELLRAEEEERITQRVHRKMAELIWGNSAFKAERGKHWDISFYPVNNCPSVQNSRFPNVGLPMERRRVVVVSICKFPGGVFTSCPESFVIDREKKVHQMSFTEWKEEILNQSRDRPELHNRFVKISFHTPFSRLVYSLPHTLQAAKEKVLNMTSGFNLQPKQYLDTLTDTHLRTCIQQVLSTFQDEPHLAIPLHCWGTHLSSPFHEDMRAVLLIVSEHYGLHLAFFVSSYLNIEVMFKMTQQISVELKQRLVRHGGCVERLGIKLHLLNMGNSLMLPNFQVSIDEAIYPPTFAINKVKMENIVTSILITIASYKSHIAQSPSDEYFYLLTCDQLELLWTRQFTKQLWIHGPPGAGKTVAALEMIRELICRGCQPTQVLYVAENPLLCTCVSSFNLCMVVSRRELMGDYSTIEIFLKKYKDVRNVIVDEAQNFKDRDGDWYSLVEKLSSEGITSFMDPNSPASSSCEKTKPVSSLKFSSIFMANLIFGYFWVFMDYAQKVHKFQAGLPGLIGKNNFMLSEISRNTKEIFDYAMKFLNKPTQALSPGSECVTDVPVLGHTFESGHGVEVMKCGQDAIYSTLFSVLQTYLRNGVEPNDIAILVSKQKDTEVVQKSVAKDLDEKADASVQKGMKEVMVDTVRRFSGLDKPIIIGLDPHANSEHADIDKFIVNLATRAKDGLVIITTSEDLLKKLRDQ